MAVGSNLPQAYLKYIYYDTQGNYLSSGYQLLSAAANGAYEQLSLELPADRDGYVQVFVANESLIRREDQDHLLAKE